MIQLPCQRFCIWDVVINGFATGFKVRIVSSDKKRQLLICVETDTVTHITSYEDKQPLGQEDRAMGDIPPRLRQKYDAFMSDESYTEH